MNLKLPDDIPLISGDRDRLIQVLINLISNAVKFCDSSGARIDIGVTSTSEHLRVDVCDNGIGIRPEDLDIIFEDFRQAKDNVKGRPPGSGLGLAIARRIVHFHGGRIWAEINSGRGSTFTFTLPIEWEKLPAPEPLIDA